MADNRIITDFTPVEITDDFTPSEVTEVDDFVPIDFTPSDDPIDRSAALEKYKHEEPRINTDEY